MGRASMSQLRDVDPDDARKVTFTLQDTVACGSSNPEAWKVPTTWRYLPPEGANVTDVLFENETAPNLEGVRNTAIGVRSDGNETLLSLTVGQSMVLMHDAPVERGDLDVLGMTDQWNGLRVAVTVAGHDTWDLFRWSKRFNDEPELRFTWLVILEMPIQRCRGFRGWGCWPRSEPSWPCATSSVPMTGRPPLRRTRKPAPSLRRNDEAFIPDASRPRLRWTHGD